MEDPIPGVEVKYVVQSEREFMVEQFGPWMDETYRPTEEAGLEALALYQERTSSTVRLIKRTTTIEEEVIG